MWKIFTKEEKSLEQTILDIEGWKDVIFNILRIEVKKYFAEKVIVYFDNNMLFKQQRGFHNNLMEALAMSQEDMYSIQGVFPQIKLYWLREDHEQILLVYGLKNEYENTLIENGFILKERNASILSGKDEALEYNSWQTLVFDVELINYAENWIRFAPNLEIRARLQTEFILLNTHFKKEDLSMLDKISFEDNITQHSSYEELYQKIYRVMPKIEKSLSEEWKAEYNTVKIDAAKKPKKKI